MTAEIVSFPAPPRTAESRLDRAMAELEAALAAQRAAIAGWRDSLKELQRSVESLGLGLRRYQITLHALGADITALNTAARRLEKQAGTALRSTAI
jgi:septal ring factor EnvC (AmiA/AmiB activator)